MTKSIVFAFIAGSKERGQAALMLARSIRTFGGLHSHNPIWVLVPNSLDALREKQQEAFDAIRVRLIPFELSEEQLVFPFAPKVLAAGKAEEEANGKVELIAWMDADAIMLNDPSEMILQPDKVLGYRPVDHTLIGSRYEEPLDDFWKMVYEDCGADDADAFSMVASVDQATLRPYFNAGLLVIRPERALLRVWRDNFEKLYLEERYKEFYEKNTLYKIFVHQAILAGTILAKVPQLVMHEFPPHINYPLHMHEDYPEDQRPEDLESLVSCRADMFFDQPDWETRFPGGELLKSWVKAHL